jgi:hypothetical protein
MFRLGKVLEWKERLEEDARARRLAVETRATEIAREADRLRAERGRFPDVEPTSDVLAELAAWARRSELLRRGERSARARLEAMRTELEARRAEHLALRQEVESLRKLRDRRLREERRLREGKMQETIDEAAARRFLPGAGRKFPGAAPPAPPAGSPAHRASPDENAGFPPPRRREP